MTQTAVQWLEQQMKKFALDLDLLDCVEQAKQMEKEQHEDTWLDSRIEDKGDNYIGKEKSFEQYYNETYGKK